MVIKKEAVQDPYTEPVGNEEKKKRKQPKQRQMGSIDEDRIFPMKG